MISRVRDQIRTTTLLCSDYIAHEVEAAVLYNQITMDNPFTEEIWSIAPIIAVP